jgi:DNA (cytosine-5)-methyltransferase 1
MGAKNSSLRAVSLFSNCGAGDVGFRAAGFLFTVLAELQQRRLDVAGWNHPGARLVSGDLRSTWRTVVQAYRESFGEESLDLLSACPPCQGLSSAQGRRGMGDDADAGSRDHRNLLVVPIANVVHELRPRVIVIENVPAFLTRKVRHPETGEPVSAAHLLIALVARDYEVYPLVTDLCDFGVPQTRRRAFLTFLRRDMPAVQALACGGLVPYPIPSHAPDFGGVPISLESALGEMHLSALDARSQEMARPLGAPALHFVPVWEDRRYPMVAAIEVRSGKSAWENEECERCGRVKAGRHRANCPECGGPLLRPVVKARNGRYRLIKGFTSSSYRRMHPTLPASTVTTASGHIGSDFTIHPWENRVLSPLECALLQTFPGDFQWRDALERWGHTAIREMIGEAVPPHFTHLHGKVLIQLIQSKELTGLLSAKDPRSRRGRKTLIAAARSALNGAPSQQAGTRT